jgi:hypothetical protein
MGSRLREPQFAPQAATIDQVIWLVMIRHWWQTLWPIGLGLLLAHAAIWLVLAMLYPRLPWLQENVFWKRWPRRILGLGYVGFLLANLSPLRRWLLRPYANSLKSDAAFNTFRYWSYFPHLTVRGPAPSEQKQPIDTALKLIRGQVVLVGASGLGKSSFLLHRVLTSKTTLAYLPARRCMKGVKEAIRTKLQIPSRDKRFLDLLIERGALDIAIDGLNEVSVDTRAAIREFVEYHSGVNVILTTQPIEWEPPANAKLYHLLELERRKTIRDFLLSRIADLPADATVKGENFRRACEAFLHEQLDQQRPATELKAIKDVLSNPMDLTMVAQIIAQGDKPDLFHLQEQQYQIMEREFQRTHPAERFPLKKFSERVYQLRLSDAETSVPAEEFPAVIPAMEKHKLVVSRETETTDSKQIKKWHFRHDKIADFFLVKAFLDRPERRHEHQGDPRFRGVYFLLALLLPEDDARDLKNNLVDYAADHGDHTISDPVVRLCRTRSARPNGHARARQFELFWREGVEDGTRRATSAEILPGILAVAEAEPSPGTKEWGLMNRRRSELIRKKNRGGLSAEEQQEFARLQRLCFSKLEELSPGPRVDEEGLRRLREGL